MLRVSLEVKYRRVDHVTIQKTHNQLQHEKPECIDEVHRRGQSSMGEEGVDVVGAVFRELVQLSVHLGLPMSTFAATN